MLSKSITLILISLVTLGLLLLLSCKDGDKLTSKKATKKVSPVKKIIKKDRKVSIHLIGLGDIANETMATAKAELEKRFSRYNIVLSYNKIPAISITRIKTMRYRADSLIRIFRPANKDTIVLLLTEKDISSTKIKEPKATYQDWGIMGLAYCPGNSAIVSTFRLKSASKTITNNRLKKVITHEIGHSLGLPHCTTQHCVMSDANESVSSIDQEGGDFCENCMMRIGEN
jgi:archaemetzincin